MISEGNQRNLHCTMCETKRAALVSLHVSLPWARSCFTCRANRYLRIRRETGVRHIDMGVKQRGRGGLATKSGALCSLATRPHSEDLKKYKPKNKKVCTGRMNSWCYWLQCNYSHLPSSTGRHMLQSFHTMSNAFHFIWRDTAISN